MKHLRDRPIESTPTSALDQWGLLVQSRLPSADDTLAGFKKIIVPQFDAAYKLARFLCRDADAAHAKGRSWRKAALFPDEKRQSQRALVDEQAKPPAISESCIRPDHRSRLVVPGCLTADNNAAQRPIPLLWRPVILQPLLNGGANTTCNLPLLQKVGHLPAEGQQLDSKRRRDFSFGFATGTGHERALGAHDRGRLPGWPTWKPVAFWKSR